ncbi:MAG: PAS domain-containing protein [Lewinellaceae bacterium]|nr:PAS domain-containing protein [Saprospiraceae bacterium]MCB9316098.1 PAS domain-containing protein [Lewinellaceae bacterium]MCB9333323.1 PAS domain-containing protein [Lewinellaceae bacterium]
MAANQIEIILSRQLADCLSIPIFLTDPEGNLLFYNEPAEELLGKRYEETGLMPVEEWSTMFKPIGEDGNPLEPQDLPLVKTLMYQRPAHGTFLIESLQGERVKISVTAYPIIGRPDRFLGAVAIFWKTE